MMHPVGVFILLTIQWHAWICKLFCREIPWKGRAGDEAKTSHVDTPGVGVSDLPT
jgi:hypothetical protein